MNFLEPLRLHAAWSLLGMAVFAGACWPASELHAQSGSGLGKPVALSGANTVYQDARVLITAQRTASTYDLDVSTASGARTRISLLNTPWNIEPIRVSARGRIIVYQPLQDPWPGSPQRIYIIDAESGLLGDEFNCEQPAISPDGHYLAFVAAYPNHTEIDDYTSNFVMLYDLERDARANRNQPRFDFPLADDPDRQAGAQVFPKWRPAHGSAKPDGTVRTIYSVTSDLVWSPDSSRLVFAEQAVPGEGLGAGVASDGNVIVSARLRELPSLSLVGVDVHGNQPVVSKLDLAECSGISGQTCRVDLSHAVFSQAGVTIPMRVEGTTGSNKVVVLGMRSPSD